jgi:four helix bundle protein
MEIWKLAIEIAKKLFIIANLLEKKRLYKFSEQLRFAAMSMSNNIAEGSGSYSKKDFGNFLNMARRSTFENANIVFLLHDQYLINDEHKNELLEDLDHLSRKISNFQRSLKSTPI